MQLPTAIREYLAELYYSLGIIHLVWVMILRNALKPPHDEDESDPEEKGGSD